MNAHGHAGSRALGGDVSEKPADSGRQLTTSTWPRPVSPLNLLAIWPRPDVPTIEEIQAGFAIPLGEPLRLKPEQPDDPQTRWVATGRASSMPGPVTIWCEPLRDLAPQDKAALNTHGLRWVVGVATVLDPDDPQTHFVRLIQMLGRGIPGVPAILNLNAGGMWYREPELSQVILDQEIEPTADIMWATHLLSQHQTLAPGDCAWLTSEGLWCCGVPELEILDVPGDGVVAACQLLTEAAQLILQDGMPDPGEPWEVGPGLSLCLRSWMEIASTRAAEQFGSMNSRQRFGHQTDRGPRAVLCADVPASGGIQPPMDVIGRIQRGESAIYRTARWTHRQSRLAHRTWTSFLGAFESVRRANPPNAHAEQFVFMVKAAFVSTSAAIGDPQPSREHLWFEALAFEGDRVQARLVHPPSFITTMRAGEVRWLARDTITDWHVSIPSGTFGPETAAALTFAMAGRQRPG